ncbi:GGDEF domain-containing protein [Marinobacterium sp. D7]|uniref:GGDEF domain-containing protein n=1 Tax=Marinobacterium ramblicola TaxID=2849041 RepID=UPI001C2D85A8|nr:GGDEF domain-containing protein [Marinobacterium ramblicola]MBV1789822.1 GGDEF domain-containing protein [Marinobacterium ramblicola]
MIRHRYISGLTARTVGITFLVAITVIGATVLTYSTLKRMHLMIDEIVSTDMENLMTSVRLVQQSESLISLDLILTGAENHTQRRTALIELNDRLAWIGQLSGQLLSRQGQGMVVNQIKDTQQQLSDSIQQLNSLVRKRIDGSASDSELLRIVALSSTNQELAGRLSVMLGYFAANMRQQMTERSGQLTEEINQHQLNLVVLTALLLLSALLAGLYFELTVVRRILHVQRAVSRPEVRPDEIRVAGDDEITQLATTVGTYVERIQTQEAHMLKIHDELAYLAEHDPLTGLSNRRHLYALATRLIEQSTQPVCVAIGDIDYFKAVNDRFGHTAGDQVLIHVAEQLRNGLRESDILARYGGEEFAVVLAVHNQDAARTLIDAIAERVRSGTATLENGEQVELTMSFGFAVVDPGAIDEVHGADAQALLNQALNSADNALYDAKTRGRNRAVMASTTPDTEEM